MQKHKYGGGLSLLINTYKNQHLCCIHTKWTLSRSPHLIKPVFFPQKKINHYFAIITKTHLEYLLKLTKISQFGNLETLMKGERPGEADRLERGDRRSDQARGWEVQTVLFPSASAAFFSSIPLLPPFSYLSLCIFDTKQAQESNKTKWEEEALTLLVLIRFFLAGTTPFSYYL